MSSSKQLALVCVCLSGYYIRTLLPSSESWNTGNATDDLQLLITAWENFRKPDWVSVGTCLLRSSNGIIYHQHHPSFQGFEKIKSSKVLCVTLIALYVCVMCVRWGVAKRDYLWLDIYTVQACLLCFHPSVHVCVCSIVRRILRRHFIAQWLSPRSVSFFLNPHPPPPLVFHIELLTHSVALWRPWGVQGSGKVRLRDCVWLGHTLQFCSQKRSKDTTTSCYNDHIQSPTNIYLIRVTLTFVFLIVKLPPGYCARRERNYCFISDLASAGILPVCQFSVTLASLPTVDICVCFQDRGRDRHSLERKTS